MLYHRRPLDMRGNVLYPLNVLRDTIPEIDEHQGRKYDGREELLQQRIVPLDCLWNDALHLSPVHPGDVAQVAKSEGVAWSEADWFEIDPSNFTGADTAIFRYTDITISTTIPPDEFASFDQPDLAKLSEIPTHWRDYYRTADKGGKYFIFCGVPHILHRGNINIEHAPLVCA